VYKSKAKLSINLNKYYIFKIRMCTASVVLWSEFLATDTYVPGSIPGAFTFSEKQRVCNRGPLSLVRTTEELLGRKSSGSGLENRD
jgi:hypothetical protein